ncbi:MAG: DnaJ domain-containing protein [Oscillospiraceae bacterium]|nr:DnaJ domain-containing protein [Oscillospiraceae bacterium]
MNDPYQVLGVSRSASDEEIKAAYRKLAQQYHPDLHPGDAAAAQRMKEINAAYDQIKNPEAWQNTAGTASQTQQQAYRDPFSGWSYNTYAYGSRRTDPGVETDPRLRSARAFNQSRQFHETIRVLEQIDPALRGAEWFYLAAVAHYGLNNQITALRYARTAVQMDPYNAEYRQLLDRLQWADQRYRSVSHAPALSGIGRLVAGICAFNLLIRFCRCLC